MESFISVSLIRDLFPFSVASMPDKSSNVPSSAVYSTTGAESLRIVEARSDPESFSTAIKPLIACMRRQKVSIAKINSVILKFFNKHERNYNDVCQRKKELLHLDS